MSATLVRILVVEDFIPFRSLLTSLLQQRPEWQVVAEVLNGLEAVQRAKDLSPDLILLDIGLPNLNGIEAAPADPQDFPKIQNPLRQPRILRGRSARSPCPGGARIRSKAQRGKRTVGSGRSGS